MVMIKIPKRYYQDHKDNVSEFEPPKIIRETGSHYFVDSTPGPEWDEFLQRCRMYAEDVCNDYWNNGCSGLVISARATLKAIKGNGNDSAL
jgi:hypothetical protein